MNSFLWWNNLVASSAQIAALAAGGVLLPWVLKGRLPRARLLYYQALLALCLLWPATQPWRRTVIPSYRPAPVTRAGTPAPSLPTPAHSRGIPWQELALIALGAGAAIRLSWLSLGLWRLRRYRLESDLLYPLPRSVDDADAFAPIARLIWIGTAAALSTAAPFRVTDTMRFRSDALPGRNATNTEPFVSRCKGRLVMPAFSS